MKLRPDMDFQKLADTLWNELSSWTESFVEMLPNLVVAVAVVVSFVFLARLARRGASRALEKMGMHSAARGMLSTLVHIGVLLGGVMIALSVLNLDGAAASLLAGAGVVGLALGFAFQDLAANFISGVGLSVKRPFRVGDTIETNDVFGVVETISLRVTEIRTNDGKRVLIPNTKLFQEVLTNHTDNELRRVDLECGVSYGDDLDHVRATALEALGGLEARHPSREPEVLYTGFGGSSIDFVARFWIDYSSQGDYKRAVSEAVVALKKAFDENDITIPFPIRTLDFGIEGGVPLSQMLPAKGKPTARAADPN